MAGYSGRPLAAKLGIEPGHRVVLRHAPADFAATLAPLPDGVTFGARLTGAAPIVVVFATEAARLAAEFSAAAARAPTGGMIWVAWPKKAAKRATDLDEDVVRGIGLAAGWVDVKVCAIDEVWSGLKFLRRRGTPAPRA